MVGQRCGVCTVVGTGLLALTHFTIYRGAKGLTFPRPVEQLRMGILAVLPWQQDPAKQGGGELTFSRQDSLCYRTLTCSLFWEGLQTPSLRLSGLYATACSSCKRVNGNTIAASQKKLYLQTQAAGPWAAVAGLLGEMVLEASTTGDQCK